MRGAARSFVQCASTAGDRRPAVLRVTALPAMPATSAPEHAGVRADAEPRGRDGVAMSTRASRTPAPEELTPNRARGRDERVRRRAGTSSPRTVTSYRGSRAEDRETQRPLFGTHLHRQPTPLHCHA